MAEKIEDKKKKFAEGLWKFCTDIFSNEKEAPKKVKFKTDNEKNKTYFADAKLQDGTMITYDGDTPMVGMPIMVLPSDGTAPIPAPDGVMVVEDGSEIEVKNGVIVSVEPVEDMSQENIDQNTPPDPNKKNIQMDNKTPVTEQAAKRLIESHVKETVFSKTEVDEKLKAFTTEFETLKTEFADLKKSSDAIKSENETLVKEFGTIKAENVELRKSNETLSKFAKQIPTILEEAGFKPQVQETEEEKKKRLEAFQSETKPKMTRKEWQQLMNV